jgi:methionine synthase II (cobalamin-independent)
VTPPVRAHHVGSLLRPDGLRAAFRRHGGGEIGDDELRRAQDEAVRDVVALQEDLGLRVVTDGELRRASYWCPFVAAVDGLEVGRSRFTFTDGTGDRLAFTAPHPTGPLRWTGPISGPELDFLAAVASATPKITLPSPSTMQFWHGPLAGAYPSSEDFFADLAAVYRAEIADLAARGATLIQLDEVALAMLCDPAVRDTVAAAGEVPGQLVDDYVAAIAAAGAERPAGITLALHVCRRNYKGHWMHPAATSRWPRPSSAARASTSCSWSSTVPDRAGSSRCATCPPLRRSCWGWSARRPPSSSAATTSCGASRRRPATWTSSAWPSRPSAASPAPRAATRSARTTSAASSRSWSRCATRSGAAPERYPDAAFRAARRVTLRVVKWRAWRASSGTCSPTICWNRTSARGPSAS